MKLHIYSQQHELVVLVFYIPDDQQASSSIDVASVSNDDDNPPRRKRKAVSTKQTASKKSRSLRKSTSEEFYVEFKRCRFNRVNTVVDESDKSECHETIEDNIRLLLALINENKGYGQKLMYNFAVIGKTLKYLKVVLKFKNKDLDKLLKEYGSQFSINMRTFYIKLYNFSEKYTKVLYVDISEIGIGNLFNKWSKLKDFIKKDQELWQ